METRRFPAIASLRVAVALLVAVGLQSGCATQRGSETAPELVALTQEVFSDYQRGDCVAVLDRTDPTVLGRGRSEVHYALILLHGFCLELEDERERARAVYREIVRSAPLSFAADDARERLRLLGIMDRDPDYARWVADAPSRHVSLGSDRIPVERVPAGFPPVAEALGIGGYALVEFGVTPRGETDAPVVVESDPPLLFDGAALRAVREWRYLAEPRSKQTPRQVIRIVFQASTPTMQQPNPADGPTQSSAVGTSVTP